MAYKAASRACGGRMAPGRDIAHQFTVGNRAKVGYRKPWPILASALFRRGHHYVDNNQSVCVTSP